MLKIINWLKGKKSYVVGLAVVGYGVYSHFFGDQLSFAETIELIFGGSALMTVRAAMAKIGLNK